MDFLYLKKCNIDEGQELYGFIESSIYTYSGIYKIKVDTIDWNAEEVIFEIDQPCEYVYCSFNDLSNFVFETQEDAENNCKDYSFTNGLSAYME